MVYKSNKNCVLNSTLSHMRKKKYKNLVASNNMRFGAERNEGVVVNDAISEETDSACMWVTIVCKYVFAQARNRVLPMTLTHRLLGPDIFTQSKRVCGHLWQVLAILWIRSIKPILHHHSYASQADIPQWNVQIL